MRLEVVSKFLWGVQARHVAFEERSLCVICGYTAPHRRRSRNAALTFQRNFEAAS